MPTKTALKIEPQKILKEVFGHDIFRGDQKAVIDSVLAGQDSLCLMPTGMGKSLCFQIPARILGGLTVVISPLIALMQDQAAKAKERGFKVADIHSLLKKEDREKRYKKLKNQEYELLFVAPERFRKEEFREALKANQVNLLAIDEAHCISEWGHDFRPDYTRIKEMREFMGNPTTLMLTATATPEVQKDILKQVGLDEDKVRTFHSGIKRENLSLNVDDLYGEEQKIQRLIEVASRIKGPKIVYFSLISTLEKCSEKIDKKFPHLKYHGQLPRGLRQKMQKQFIRSDLGDEDDHLILATPAFGLGIDKQNIRAVMHFELPANIEALYQEMGRAGRDGKPSECHVLYDEDDVTIQMEFLKWAHPDAEFISRVYQYIKQNTEKANQEGLDAIRENLHFYNRKDFRLETALNLFDRWEVTSGDILDKDLKVIAELPAKLVDQKRISERLKNSQMNLLKLLQWVKTSECRALEIYKYFGFEDIKKCGICDNCKASNE
ncbi:MAG: RecQ family ATP-dependent DNA helicase [Bdellovibrionota bacterium]